MIRPPRTWLAQLYMWTAILSTGCYLYAWTLAGTTSAATVQVGGASATSGAGIDRDMAAAKRVVNAKRALSDGSVCATILPGGSVMPACPAALNNAEFLVFYVEVHQVFREAANQAVREDTIAECVTRFNTLSQAQKDARCANAGLADGCTAVSVCQ